MAVEPSSTYTFFTRGANPALTKPVREFFGYHLEVNRLIF
jgi:hypothetical protein